MKTIIHVNQHVIKANRATGARDPEHAERQRDRDRQAARAVKRGQP